MKQGRNKLFRNLSIASLVAVYILVLVGGIVRSTGSGMGCPDWPRCFGQWVPPTTVAQLPENYKEIYAQHRAEKNQRFAKYLNVLGFGHLSNQILTDESILEEADFNRAKTWTEYVNRLVGVMVGLLIVATFIASLKSLKTDKKLFSYALLAVILVSFQGWIGSIVVSTNLMPWMITVHMIIALLIVANLTFLVVRSGNENKVDFQISWLSKSNIIVIIALVLTVVQIIIGTQVREAIDEVSATLNYKERGTWITGTGNIFLVHRTYAWVVVLVSIAMIFVVRKAVGNQDNVLLWSFVILVLVGLEVFSGAIMHYFGIPRFAQPVHLGLAALIFGLQFLVLLKLNQNVAQPATYEVA